MIKYSLAPNITINTLKLGQFKINQTCVCLCVSENNKALTQIIKIITIIPNRKIHFLLANMIR